MCLTEFFFQFVIQLPSKNKSNNVFLFTEIISILSIFRQLRKIIGVSTFLVFFLTMKMTLYLCREDMNSNKLKTLNLPGFFK